MAPLQSPGAFARGGAGHSGGLHVDAGALLPRAQCPHALHLGGGLPSFCCAGTLWSWWAAAGSAAAWTARCAAGTAAGASRPSTLCRSTVSAVVQGSCAGVYGDSTTLITRSVPAVGAALCSAAAGPACHMQRAAQLPTSHLLPTSPTCRRGGQPGRAGAAADDPALQAALQVGRAARGRSSHGLVSNC